MNNFPKIMLWLNALSFLGFALLFGFIPEPLLRWLTGGIPETASGMIDLRANYAGMAVAIGLYSLRLASKQRIRSGLLLTGLVLVGLMTFRGIGILFDGDASQWIIVVLAVELLFATATFSALAMTPSSQR